MQQIPLAAAMTSYMQRRHCLFLKDNFHPLFTKIYHALNPGGLFISVHDGLTHEGTKPGDMVISWLATGLSSRDLSLDRDAIPDAMLQAGV